jgi:predicted O-methyltransferase YrrM
MKNLLICLTFALSVFAVENDPYKGFEVLPFDPQGWYAHTHRMEKVFKEHKIQVVVEIGSWLGKSTRHIATLLPKGGKVYAVDHWEGSPEHQNNERLTNLYHQFLSNVIHAGLTDKIVPVKMDSLSAAKQLEGTKVDLVYIDGAHETEPVLKDLNAWYPFVKGHGVICGDDWRWESVAKAVTIFAKENNLKIYHKKSFWQLY